MCPGLMVRAVSTQAAELSTSSFNTLLLLNISHIVTENVQASPASSYFQVETYECRVKIAFYTSKLEVLDCYQAPQQSDNLTDEGNRDII
jgi:hypothetical protein